MAANLLSDLDVPASLFGYFQKWNVGIFELLTISYEELDGHLAATDTQWQSDEIFNSIDSWRKRNKQKILRLLSVVTKEENVTDESFLPDIPQQGTANEVTPQASESQANGNDSADANATGSKPKGEILYEFVVEPASSGTQLKLPSSLPVEEKTAEDKPDDNLVEHGGAAALDVPSSSVANVLNNPLPIEVETDDEDLAAEEEEDGVAVAEAEAGNSSVNNSSVVPHFSPRVLRDLLLSTERGNVILQKAALGELSEAKQRELAAIIAEHHLRAKKNLRAEHLEAYTLAITTLFRNESSANYYILRTGARKNLGGKIADKIGNLKQKRRKEEKSEDLHAKKLRPDLETSTTTTAPKENQATNWLKLNDDPWKTVLEYWPLSFEYRSALLKSPKHFEKLLKQFPHYFLTHGYQLIDSDFDQLFPKTPNNKQLSEDDDAEDGLQELKTIAAKFKSYIKEKANDPSADSLVQHLSSGSDASRFIAFLLALNTVLPPISAGYRYKPTIAEAQEDTVVFAENEEDAATRIEAIYAKYSERNLPAVPKIVVFGSGVSQISGRYFVYYKDTHYELKSPQRAVDVLIKFTAVFDLPYSKYSKLVWHFLSGSVYGIPQKESYASVTKLHKFYITTNPPAC